MWRAARAANVSDACGNFLTHSEYENKRKQFKSETETITSIVVSSSGTFFLIAYLFIILVNVIALIPSRWQQCDNNTHYYYTHCVCRSTKIAFDYILRSLRLYKQVSKSKFENVVVVIVETNETCGVSHIKWITFAFVWIENSFSWIRLRHSSSHSHTHTHAMHR